MSKLKHEKELTELEYMLEKYERENISPILSKSYKTLVANQRKESQKYLNSQSTSAGAFVPIHAQAFRYATEMQKLEWNSKDVNWLIRDVVNTVGKDGNMQQDLRFLVENYQILLLKELGKDQYLKRSKEVGMDLGSFYVQCRLKDKLMDQLAKYKVPKSSMEYVVKKIMDDSIIGSIRNWTFGDGSAAEKQLKDKIEKVYSPSFVENAVAYIGASTVDIATTYLSPIPVKVGPVPIKFSLVTTAAIEVAGRALTSGVSAAANYIWDDTGSEKLSKHVFGSSDTIKQLESNAKKIAPSNSNFIKKLNRCLENPVKLPQGKYSPYEYKTLDKLFLGASNDSEKLIYATEQAAMKENVKLKKNGGIPPWMQKMSRAELMKYGAHFTAIAMTMKNNNVKQMKVDGKIMTVEQVWQKGYNYLAAVRQYDIDQQKKKAEEQAQNQASQQQSQETNAVQAANSQQNSQQNGQQNSQQNGQQNGQQKQSDQYAGWADMLEEAMPNGAKDIISNLGYILAILPDLIAGMFTGNGKALSLKDNILPLAAIVTALFVKKNLFLKMLLLGFGGATLFYKASKDALNLKKLNEENTKPYRIYKTYADEPLDSRLSNPTIKDGALLMSIDGDPNVITLSETALENYRQGKLPLNTLANKVLEVWDKQNLALNEELENERTVANRQTQNRTI